MQRAALIRSLWLVSALTGIRRRAAPQGIYRLIASWEYPRRVHARQPSVAGFGTLARHKRMDLIEQDNSTLGRHEAQLSH
jgi:hypothetical protein